MLVAWRSDVDGQGRADDHPIERLLPLLAIQRVELPKVEMERTADPVGAPR